MFQDRMAEQESNLVPKQTFARALTLGIEYNKVPNSQVSSSRKKKIRDFFLSVEEMKSLPKHFNSPHHMLISHEDTSHIGRHKLISTLCSS